MNDNKGFDPRIDRNYYSEEEVSANKNKKSLNGEDGMKKFFKRADFPFFLLGGFVLILLIFILVKLPGEDESVSKSSSINEKNVKELRQALDDIRNEIVEIRYNLSDSGSGSSSKEELAAFLNEIDKRFEEKISKIEIKVDALKKSVDEKQTVFSIKSGQPEVKAKKPLSSKKSETDLSQTSGKNIYHTVKKGDTLYSISRKYNVSVADIKQLNNMKTNSIQPGGKLLIKNN
jgi:hypothetical protein